MTRPASGSWLWIAWSRFRHSGVVELAACVGYASRGMVYLSVAIVALLKAAGKAPHAEGAMGALAAWAQWPVGHRPVVGRRCWALQLAAWRALQSLVDIERLGWSLKALITRLGKAVSGLLYGALGAAVLQTLDTLRDVRKGDADADAVASVQHTLTLPFGRTLAVGFGLLLLAVGLGNMIRAFVDHFTGALGSGPALSGVIGLVARVGYFARGVAFLPASAFIVIAGWRSRPHEALSIGHALDRILALPFGVALLTVQALGLGAFGVFGLAKAVCRRVELDDPI